METNYDSYKETAKKMVEEDRVDPNTAVMVYALLALAEAVRGVQSLDVTLSGKTQADIHLDAFGRRFCDYL